MRGENLLVCREGSSQTGLQVRALLLAVLAVSMGDVTFTGSFACGRGRAHVARGCLELRLKEARKLWRRDEGLGEGSRCCVATGCRAK